MAKRNNFKDWIILETEDYVFINKPAGISSLKERGNQNSDDILSLARLYQADMKLCHRLDKYPVEPLHDWVHSVYPTRKNSYYENTGNPLENRLPK